MASPRVIKVDPNNVVTGQKLDLCPEYTARIKIADWLRQQLQDELIRRYSGSFVMGIVGYTVTGDNINEPSKLLIALPGSETGSTEENEKRESTLEKFINKLITGNKFERFLQENRLENLYLITRQFNLNWQTWQHVLKQAACLCIKQLLIRIITKITL